MCAPYPKPGFSHPKCVARDTYNSYFRRNSDGKVNWTAAELNNECKYCGNGLVDSVGEECDLGNKNGTGQGCSSSCQIEGFPEISGSEINLQPCFGAVNYIGINPLNASTGTVGKNNPITIQARAKDQPVNDLREIKVWISNYSFNPNTNQYSRAAYGTFYNNNGATQLLPRNVTPFGFTPGNGQGICTDSSGNQRQCNTNSAADVGSSIAYVTVSRVQNTGTELIIDFQVGLLNSTIFNGNVQVWVNAIDSTGSPTGWTPVTSPVSVFRADLSYPSVSVSTTLTSETTFNVQYSSSDSGSGVVTASKTCSANISPGQPPLILSRVSHNPQSFTYSSTTSYNCTESPAVTNGLVAYSLNTTLPDGSLKFEMTISDRACNSISANKTLQLVPSWLMTSKGDTYAPDIQQITNLPTTIENTNLPNYDKKSVRLSTFNLMEADAAIKSGIQSASERGFVVVNYKDSNGVPPASSKLTDWFDFLKERVNFNLPNKTKKLTSANFANQNTSAMTGVPAAGPAVPAGSEASAKVNVVETDTAISAGNLTLTNITCDTKTVFIVNGNLTINPPFKISESAAKPINDLDINGCMFVVKGTTTVNEGTPGTSVLGISTVRDKLFSDIKNAFDAAVKVAGEKRSAKQSTGSVLANNTANGDDSCRVGITTYNIHLFNNINSGDKNGGYVSYNQILAALNSVTSTYNPLKKELRFISPRYLEIGGYYSNSQFDNLDLVFVVDANNHTGANWDIATNPVRADYIRNTWLNGTNFVVVGDNSRWQTAQQAGTGNFTGDHAAGTVGPFTQTITNDIFRYIYDAVDNYPSSVGVAWHPKQVYTGITNANAPSFFNGFTVNFNDNSPGLLQYGTNINFGGSQNGYCLFMKTLYDGIGDIAIPTAPKLDSCIVGYIPEDAFSAPAKGGKNNGFMIIDTNAGHPTRSKLNNIIAQSCPAQPVVTPTTPTPSPTVKPTTVVTVTTTPTAIPNVPKLTTYDLVEAFIVTTSFVDNKDPNADGLFIRGSVITKQGNQFKRDAGKIFNQNNPSELFEYDGGRYIHLFGSILNNATDFTIRERQFLESLQ